MGTKGLVLFEIIIRFIWIPNCYGSAAIMIILPFQCGGRLQTSESDIYRRQILTLSQVFGLKWNEYGIE